MIIDYQLLWVDVLYVYFFNFTLVNYTKYFLTLKFIIDVLLVQTSLPPSVSVSSFGPLPRGS